MRLADEDPNPWYEGDDADAWRDALDREFPSGDGTADTVARVVCPHCGESVDIALDPGGGGAQEYVEDCEVCCRPWSVSIRYHGDGSAEVAVAPLDS